LQRLLLKGGRQFCKSDGKKTLGIESIVFKKTSKQLLRGLTNMADTFFKVLIGAHQGGDISTHLLPVQAALKRHFYFVSN